MNLEWENLQQCLEDRPIFKFGSKTGLTAGKYIGVEEEEDGMRTIVAQPYIPEINFTEPGDSQKLSLFYGALQLLCSLALHIAKDEEENSRGIFLG